MMLLCRATQLCNIVCNNKLMSCNGDKNIFLLLGQRFGKFYCFFFIRTSNIYFYKNKGTARDYGEDFTKDIWTNWPLFHMQNLKIKLDNAQKKWDTLYSNSALYKQFYYIDTLIIQCDFYLNIFFKFLILTKPQTVPS